MIDLHTHTSFSDGSQTPTELLTEAAGLGLSAIAVTDHDTVEGLAEAVAAGKRLGVRVVPGVEINLEHERVTMDLLGYFIGSWPNDALKDQLAELRAFRDERNARIVARLAELGYPLDTADLDSLAEDGAVGRPHIGEAMRRRGYVDSISEAFERFLRRGAPAWIDRQRLSLPRAIKLLRASGGLPVLAHPGIIRTDKAGLERIVREAARLGLAGVECYHPLHDAETVTRCLDLAAKYVLVPTGGSDYHGSVKPKTRLGIGAAGRPVPDHLLADLACLAADGRGRLAASPTRG